MSGSGVKAVVLVYSSERPGLAKCRHSHLFALLFDGRTMMRYEIDISNVHVGY
jgi:hypothetical protein